MLKRTGALGALVAIALAGLGCGQESKQIDDKLGGVTAAAKRVCDHQVKSHGKQSPEVTTARARFETANAKYLVARQKYLNPVDGHPSEASTYPSLTLKGWMQRICPSVSGPGE